MFTILVWGVTFISTKHLEIKFTAFEILYIRYVIAYIVLWAIQPKFLKFKSFKEELYFLIAAISGASLYQYLENLSVVYTSPSSVSFITSAAPIFTAILAHFMLIEKINKKIVFGMIISMLGVFFICFGDSLTMETGLVGDVIILFAVALWAVYSIVIKKVAEFGYSQFFVTRRIFFYSLIVMLPFALYQMPSFDYSLLYNANSFGNLMFLGVFASALCFVTWNLSVEKLGVNTTSKYLFVMPVITLVAQCIYDNKSVGVIALLGMALILLGIAVTEFDFRDLFRKIFVRK